MNSIPLYIQMYIIFVILGYIINFYYINSILIDAFRSDDQKFKRYGAILIPLIMSKSYIPYRYIFLKTDFKKEYSKKQQFLDMSYIEYVITQMR